MFAYAYHAPIMGHRAADPFSTAEIARRLKLTRLALGYKQPMMSVLAGLSIPAQAWSNYENGTRRISLDVAQKLHTNLGITLHWIYRGDMNGLSEDLAAKIALQIRDEARKARR